MHIIFTSINNLQLVCFHLLRGIFGLFYGWRVKLDQVDFFILLLLTGITRLKSPLDWNWIDGIFCYPVLDFLIKTFHWDAECCASIFPPKVFFQSGNSFPMEFIFDPVARIVQFSQRLAPENLFGVLSDRKFSRGKFDKDLTYKNLPFLFYCKKRFWCFWRIRR